jgi:hypothetical protein
MLTALITLKEMDIFQKTRMGDISLVAFWAVTILRYNHLAKANIRCPPK